MRQHYEIVFLLLLYVTGQQAQNLAAKTAADPEWNGDPRLCTVNPPGTPLPPDPPMPLPVFPKQAEFSMERVEIKHVLNITLRSEMTLYEYLYDYDANKLIMVKNKNGFLDTEYYYYGINKKSTYYNGEFCVVTDIPTNNDMDGASAIMLSNGTWHIRPMNEFLLFSSDDSSRLVTPVYRGQDTVRGIPVDKWESCYINRTEYRTVKRTWAFAQKNVAMPGSLGGTYSVPIQALINASLVFPNGTEAFEFDEVFNVVSFRPGILETADALSPPKGVFCDSGSGQNLVSIEDVGVAWPNHFSVRVESSTSRSAEWQRFHLRYSHGREGDTKRLRYDYMPPGSVDFESVIHDYSKNITYIIDRRTGGCKIKNGVAIPDVSPIRDPIEFFVKNEAKFIYNPPAKAWEYNGLRSCRGNDIKCTILTTSIDKFPPFVESDTGVATGETWEATNVEYGWSVRAPFATAQLNGTKPFDYPVSLYLRMYRYNDPNNPSPLNIRTEDIEYEFYEMSHERHPYDFDTSICYRALNYEYLHLVFTLTVSRGLIVDGNHLNRRSFELRLQLHLINVMNISFSRVSVLEINHERVSNDVQAFLTLLGQTPRPGSPSGVDTDEPTAATASYTLRSVIDSGQFVLNMTLDDDSNVEFRAQPDSLKSSKQYMSTHVIEKKNIVESYTSGSQATAITVGLLVGLAVGIIIAGVIRIIRKQPMPSLPTSISNPLPSINFQAKNPTSPKATTPET